MREILFKAKQVDGNRWVFGFLIKKTFHDKFVSPPVLVYEKYFIASGSDLDLFDHIFEQVEVIPETVCQFAGILDKKNTNIFEGDICLDFIGRKIQVVYHNFRMRFEWISSDEFERPNFWASDFIDWMVWDYKTESYTNTCDVTIIGNIHD